MLYYKRLDQTNDYLKMDFFVSRLSNLFLFQRFDFYLIESLKSLRFKNYYANNLDYFGSLKLAMLELVYNFQHFFLFSVKIQCLILS